MIFKEFESDGCAIDRCGGRYDEEQSEVSLMIMGNLSSQHGWL
jgi:hypothetical protein